jgi:DNA modification methylase
MNLINDDFRNVDFGAEKFKLIFTDPPYLKEHIPIYGDLAKLAANSLEDTGSLVCYAGHYNLPDYLNLMTPYLDFWWIIAMVHQTGIGRHNAFPMNNRKTIPTWKPLLWFVKKGCKYEGKYINDSVLSRKPKKLHHEWEQSPVEAIHVISRLTEKGDKVLDPMMGSGTSAIAAIELRRNFTGVEIDPETFQKAQRRLEDIRPLIELTEFV